MAGTAVTLRTDTRNPRGVPVPHTFKLEMALLQPDRKYLREERKPVRLTFLKIQHTRL